jgi:hypothetical protein
MVVATYHFIPSTKRELRVAGRGEGKPPVVD